jgi:S1-C subfamily serine protease
MAETTPITDIKIIRPFRWWKTFGINCAIATPFAFISASARVGKYTEKVDAAYAGGEFFGSFVAAAAILGAFLALMICSAQMWALVAYYQSGQNTHRYYSRLYAVSAIVLVVSLLGFLISPLWALIYYFTRRRWVFDRIREREGIPPARPRPSVKADYTWPLVAIAAAILIAAAIVYAALQYHSAMPVSTPSPIVTASQASPAPVVRSTPDLDPSHLIAAPTSPIPASTPRQAIPLTDLAEKMAPSVVVLTAYNSDGEGLQFGTGFFIDEIGTIATNWHVITGASKVTAKTSTGEIFQVAEVLVYDTGLDMAVISLGPDLYRKTGRKFHSLAEGYKKSPPRVGSSVVVLGAPEGLEQSLSQGIVSAIRHDEAGTVIQITAPISEGSSGSPVVDDTGALLGIATKIWTAGQSLNFARSYADLEAISERTKPSSFAEMSDERLNAFRNSEATKKFLATVRDPTGANDWAKIDMAILAEQTRLFLRDFPDVALAHSLTGLAFLMMNDYPHAISECKQAITLQPEEPIHWDLLGNVFSAAGDPAQARYCSDHAQYLTRRRRLPPPRPRRLDLSPESLMGLPPPPAPTSSETRRAKPVRPEDVANAATAAATPPAESTGSNRVSIRPLKRTYIKVTVDNEKANPAFEGWISPADGTVEFRGQRITVRVLDRDAVQINKNGKTFEDGDKDVTVSE